MDLILTDLSIVRLYNQAQSPHRFFVNPSQLIDKEKELTSDPIALYHSHPLSPPVPSTEDTAMMLYLYTIWPDVHHIILSPTSQRAYHVIDDEIVERDLLWHQP